MGLFSKYNVNAAKVSGGGEYYDKCGEYVAEIDVAKAVNESTFVAETIVRESTNDEIPVGARRTIMAQLAKPWGASNLKEFLTAVNGLSSHDPADQEAIDAEDWDAITEEVIGPTNPLKGEKLRIVVYNKRKKDGSMGTRTKCLPYKPIVAKDGAK